MKHYSIDGLRDDMKFALRMAFVFGFVAALPITATGLFIAYERITGGPKTSWVAFGVLVAVAGICFVTTAIVSALVLFVMRPVRRGRLGSGIAGFVVATTALASLAALLMLFPEAAIFFRSRGNGSVPGPDTLRWMIRFSPVVGVVAGIIGAFQYSGDPKEVSDRRETAARPTQREASKRGTNTPEMRSRVRLNLLKGAIYVAIGGYFAVVGVQDLAHKTRSTGVQPSRLVVASVLMLAFGLWRVKTNLSDLKAP